MSLTRSSNEDAAKGSHDGGQLSRLSENDRAVESVRISASNLLSIFKDKLEHLQGNEEITRSFLRQGFEGKKCFDEAQRFFGATSVRYLAVDGTKFEEPRLDMFVFYAGAFAYGGVTRFHENGEIISEPPLLDTDSFSLSAAIPLSEEYSCSVYGEKGESGIEIDPSRLSTALMRLAEYYVLYQAISHDPSLKILLMDRTVSGDIAHMSWKLREYIQDDQCILTNFETKSGRISKTDLELGRMLIENKELEIPAPRSQFLKFATMSLLLKEEPLTIDEIVQKLGAKKERRSRIEDVASKDFKDAFVKRNKNSDPFQLKEEVGHYWDRLLEGTLYFAERIFNYDGKGHHLKYSPKQEKDGVQSREKWLKCEDIDYFTLILITAILNECWKRNALLLGIVKDSAANELVRTVIPILGKAKLVEEAKTEHIDEFESDTMLLQANSIVHSSSLPCPWRTFEYDVCFRTVSPEENTTSKKGECNVWGAYKNVIAPERMFVKAYFQLWNSEENPTVRSHVFLYDRPCYPQYDNIREIKLNNMDGTVQEEIYPALHFESDSPIAELSLGILNSMGLEAIPEALGHNYALFLADKRAKVAEEEATRSCVAAVDLEIARSRLDQQILLQGKFRDFRSEIESRRKRARAKPGTGK